MQFVIRKDAGPNAIFANDAFDAQIGKFVKVNLKKTDDGPVIGEVGTAKVVKVAILKKGKVAELTLEIKPDDDSVAQWTADSLFSAVDRASTSFGFKQ